MEQTIKICAMCRKVIDKDSMLCPYCRSDVNYKYFIEIAESQITRKRNSRAKFFLKALSFVIAGIIGFVGIFLISFWIGIGLAMFFSSLGLFLVDKNSYISGFDQAKVLCPECKNEAEYRWDAGVLELGKTANIICVSCKQISRVMVMY